MNGLTLRAGRAAERHVAAATLQFLGAADTAARSRYLIEAGARRIVVDRGPLQGYKQLRGRNRAPSRSSPHGWVPSC